VARFTSERRTAERANWLPIRPGRACPLAASWNYVYRLEDIDTTTRLTPTATRWCLRPSRCAGTHSPCTRRAASRHEPARRTAGAEDDGRGRAPNRVRTPRHIAKTSCIRPHAARSRLPIGPGRVIDAIRALEGRRHCPARRFLLDARQRIFDRREQFQVTTRLSGSSGRIRNCSERAMAMAVPAVFGGAKEGGDRQQHRRGPAAGADADEHPRERRGRAEAVLLCPFQQ